MTELPNVSLVTDIDTINIVPEFFWLDFESNGLHKDGKVWPLEIGFGLTDAAGNLGRTFQRVVLHQDISTSQIHDEHTSPFVRNMHNESGLWNALAVAEAEPIQTRYYPEVIEDHILHILSVHNVQHETLVLAGSTINFDRQILIEFFPKLNRFLNYRDINISSIKELCKRLNPRVYAHRPQGDANMKLHRPVADIKDSIREYLFYKENFLHEG